MFRLAVVAGHFDPFFSWRKLYLMEKSVSPIPNDVPSFEMLGPQLGN
jgi:hypothetical protein